MHMYTNLQNFTYTHACTHAHVYICMRAYTHTHTNKHTLAILKLMLYNHSLITVFVEYNDIKTDIRISVNRGGNSMR